MGIRANIMKKREIEYGNSSYFNCRQNFVESIIISLEKVIGHSLLCNSPLNEDGCGDWEFSRLHLNEFIDYVKKNKDETVKLIADIKDSCYCAEDDENELYEELLDFLIGLRDESDQRLDYIYVSWF